MDRPEAPNVRLGGLAYEAARPDRVYVGVNEYARDASGRTVAHSSLNMSVNGGAAWNDLGRRDLGEIRDLSPDLDGRTLYLATDQGVWRLRLDRTTPPRPPAQVPGAPGLGAALP
jgi:hypothetical protein